MAKDHLKDFIHEDNSLFLTIYYGRTMRKGPIHKGLFALALGIVFFFLFLKFSLHDGGSELLILLFLSTISTLTGSYILFAMDGVEINKRKGEIMEFVWFGTKFGSWKSMRPYTQITVIKQHKITYYASYAPIENFRTTWQYSWADDNEEFEICLLTENHMKRITVGITRNYKEAYEKALILAEKLGVEYAQFNPIQISERKRRGMKK